jgi:copper resistance protein C
MKISTLLSGIALISCAITADAHAHLQASTPADNSVLGVSPPTLVLNFSEAARLTALSIRKAGEAEQKLKPLPTSAAEQISVLLPQLTPGAYLVSWRVLSNDGHVTSGALRFTLVADHAADRAG